MKTVSMALGDRSYNIIVGSNLLENLNDLVNEVIVASNCFFVLDKAIETTHAAIAMQSFNKENASCVLEAIESEKTLTASQRIWSSMIEAGCDRHCPIIAIGGGIVGDVGGFAAASFMRGVPLVQVPTTLLAMVDASIGGKTGVNLPICRTDGSSVWGKNLVGSYWQPKLVVADVDALQSLDDRQFRCGLAECVKHSMLGNDDLRTFIQQNVQAILARDTQVLIELVASSATIKTEIVAKDERESGCRALLNLGHTFAHAIEPLPELSLLHGEAVSIGLCASLACAEATGLVDADVVDRTRELLTTLGLPIKLPMPVRTSDLNLLMKADKKTRDGTIHLVLPTSDNATIVDDVDESAIGLAWASVGAST
jgi:3-dehydroquinate synthase